MGNVRDAGRLRAENAPAERATPLTARQSQIAELVALGETNRSIAERLRISEHTVEHHVSDIFLRLNLKSRAQLARVMADLEHPV
jgi:DNA-binding NarL/FixJ family response regulator